jgi:enoyl-CoA hydratase/carnithine racemase
MPITSEVRDDGIRVVTMDHPPVNALTVQGWFDLAGALDEAGRDPATRVVVLRADGRGFNAGVDIKEMQSTSGFDALIGANRGC